MNKLLKIGVMAMVAGASNAAFADEASTAGGLKIKTDDGKFEFSLGGRIHFDAVYVSPDSGKPFGSDKVENTSGTYFRRVFLTFGGKLYGWEYKIEDNIAGNNCGTGGSQFVTAVTPTVTGGNVTAVTATTAASANCPGNDFQDVWVLKTIAHTGGFADGFKSKIWIGQHKVWRGIEEIGSNNNTLFLERPTVSASGIWGGRDFQQGVFYSFENPNYFLGTSVYALHKDTQNSTQGIGYNARAIWAPINDKGKVLSFGGSYSSDHADNNGGLNATYRTSGYRLGSGTITDTFANYAGNAVAGSTPSGGRNARVDSYGLEAVGIYGPVTLSGEYASADFHRDNTPRSTVEAYYVQASYFLTGEAKTFGDGKVLGAPKVNSPLGAIELKAKYESIENTDVTATSGLFGGGITGGTVTGASKNQFHDVAFGVNYYVNPSIRFMFDYVLGEADFGNAGKDKADTIAGRVQLAF